jgi:hypothetical protein
MRDDANDEVECELSEPSTATVGEDGIARRYEKNPTV